jgi:hypothetical protein
MGESKRISNLWMWGIILSMIKQILYLILGVGITFGIVFGIMWLAIKLNDLLHNEKMDS